MKDAPAAPAQPLKIPASGLAKVDDLRELLRDLGSRVGVSGGHDSHAAKPQVKQNQGDSKVLQYFQFDKVTGVAKTSELRRIHAMLLKAVPLGNKTPFRARKYSGTAHREDLHSFHKHWLGIFKAQTENPS